MKVVNETKPEDDAPVAKRQKMSNVVKDQPATIDSSLNDTGDLFSQSDSSITIANRRSHETTAVDPIRTSDKLSTTTTTDKSNKQTDTLSNKPVDVNTTIDTAGRTNGTSNSTPSPVVPAGGKRIIKIKRRKLSVSKENLNTDADHSTELKISIPKSDSIPEPPNVETAHLPM